ncbi:signal peptidase I [Candidatus Uhrbacteria bacterium]|nr:signal peptidase I [Candidatus Uhrbacteria bacterium]
MKWKKRDSTDEGLDPQDSNSVVVKIFGPTIGGILLFIIEIVQIVVIAAAIIIPIRFFLVQPFYVRGASMEPSFYDREYLLIDEISYRFSEPHRGDVVVFRYPRDTSEFFIKRIIGLPGDTVDVKGGKVIVTNEDNEGGAVLEEEYTDHVVTPGDDHVKLNPDEYFLMGDNRTASMDSRSFGPVKEEYFVGKVWLRGLPVSSFWVFDRPVYDEIIVE